MFEAHEDYTLARLQAPRAASGSRNEQIAGPARSWEELGSPGQVPLYGVVALRDTHGLEVEGYRGIRREDSGEVVSVVSDRYALVQHRMIAESVHSLGVTLEQENPESGRAEVAPGFPREQIRLYANGRRMEIKLVIGRKFVLDGSNAFYPGIRVYNSLDGAWALRMEGFALRLACTNQLYAGARSCLEFRELHLTSSEDLLSRFQKATYEILEHFDTTLGLYADARGHRMPIADFVPALVSEGLPLRHVNRMADRLPEYFGSVTWGEISRWDAYQIATDYLTHEVHVNPERERQFERSAARALLLPESDEASAMP